MDEQRVFLAVGANLGDPAAQLVEAADRLATEVLTVVGRSRLYRSAPIGPPGQPEYFNAALEVRTRLSPADLLKHTQGVESAMGRIKTERWGPRLVDVDIALYGAQQVSTRELVIPHAELANRRFVLAPLADLAPEFVVPGFDRTIAELLAALDDNPADLAVERDQW